MLVESFTLDPLNEGFALRQLSELSFLDRFSILQDVSFDETITGDGKPRDKSKFISYKFQFFLCKLYVKFDFFFLIPSNIMSGYGQKLREIFTIQSLEFEKNFDS